MHTVWSGRRSGRYTPTAIWAMFSRTVPTAAVCATASTLRPRFIPRDEMESEGSSRPVEEVASAGGDVFGHVDSQRHIDRLHRLLNAATARAEGIEIVFDPTVTSYRNIRNSSSRSTIRRR